MGGKEEILHRAGGTAKFVESGNLAPRFQMGGNGNNGLGLMTVFAKLGALFRARFSHWGNLIIKALECVGQAGTRFAGENMKTPRLSETMGGRPMSVFEDFDEQLVRNFAAAIHQSRLNSAPRAIGKIGRHVSSG